MRSYGDDLEARFPEQCLVAESYGLTSGLAYGGSTEPVFLTFFCDMHPGWGPILEYNEAPDGYEDAWFITSALEQLPEQLGYRQEEIGSGLAPFDYMAHLLGQLGYPAESTCPIMLLLQQRRHLLYADHEFPSQDAAYDALREATRVYACDQLTNEQKLEFMRHDGRLEELLRLLDDGVPYTLAIEVFPKGTADIYS